MTLSKMTFSIMTLSLKDLHVTLGLNNTQQTTFRINNTQQNNARILRRELYAECHNAECRYVECHYAECHCAYPCTKASNPHIC
jgi:hypothetical protein